MAPTISAVALLISVIPALFTATVNATPSDASSPAISVLAERAAPPCIFPEGSGEVESVVLIFNTPWDNQKRIQEILTIPSNKCIPGSLGKSVALAWPTAGNGDGSFYLIAIPLSLVLIFF